MMKHSGQKYRVGNHGQDCKSVHSNNIFSRRANISRDKGHPDRTDYQHAEGDEFGLNSNKLTIRYLIRALNVLSKHLHEPKNHGNNC